MVHKYKQLKGRNMATPLQEALGLWRVPNELPLKKKPAMLVQNDLMSRHNTHAHLFSTIAPKLDRPNSETLSVSLDVMGGGLAKRSRG